MMDIEAIARKVFPELYADDEGKGRLYALEQVEDVLDAAGVPEMEKRLEKAEKAGDALATDDEKAARKEKADADEAAKQAAEAQKQMEREMSAGQRDAAIYNAMQAIMQRLEDKDSPQDVAYDDKGLITRIGKKPVTRDQSGRVVRIG